MQVLKGAPPAPSGDPPTVASTGTACATAKDQAACKKALADIRPAAGWSQNPCPECVMANTYLVFTRGDTVGAVTSRADLAAFLSPVTNWETALFLVKSNSYVLDCDGAPNGKGVADGFEVVALTGGGCGQGDDIEGHLLHVSRAGEITDQQKWLVKPADPKCND